MANRGRPKKITAEAEVFLQEHGPTVEEIEAPSNDGFELPDNARISASPVMEPSLANEASDPFTKFKTEPHKFHYRALNKKPQNLSIKEAMGYQTIPRAEHGDLILGQIPLERRKMRENYQRQKAANQIQAASQSFRDSAQKNGVETFVDTGEKKK